MYIVKATNHAGVVSFACGTADQALDKADELSGRGFADIRIVDPKGKEWMPADLERSIS